MAGVKIKRTTIELEDELKYPAVSPADQERAEEGLTALLSDEDGEAKPYCTCASSGGYGFDQQLGIFVHHSTKPGVFCYKPSKLYYKAAVEAGIILP